jgi:hypothetical protein
MMPGFLLLWLAALIALTPAPPIPRSQTFYVAPAPRGHSTGNGTSQRPWDLATALAGAGGRIQPGDTVWLTGGRYRGAFRTRLKGEADRFIVFRQERGARATIDGTLRAEGAYLAFWGFEIMQSSPAGGTYGLEARTNHGRFINLIIHDAGTMGVSFWTPGEYAELYGCIIYNNGTRENFHHGVYAHNEQGTKRLIDNVIFNNLAYGIHAYAGPENPPQRGYLIMGNVVFNNGTISQRYRAKGNILVGGEVPFDDVEVSYNFLFYSGLEGTNLRLGYAPQVINENLIARGNLLWGGGTGMTTGSWRRPQVEQAAVAAGASDAVFVRPNAYEPGRAYIVAYNASLRAQLRADVSGVLRRGDAYELRSVQDLFGPPLARGTYDGDSIALPMQERVTPSRPIGRATSTPPATRPAFDVFVLEAPTGRRGAPSR